MEATVDSGKEFATDKTSKHKFTTKLQENFYLWKIEIV
jgi:hypothetical protein